MKLKFLILIILISMLSGCANEKQEDATQQAPPVATPIPIPTPPGVTPTPPAPISPPITRPAPITAPDATSDTESEPVIIPIEFTVHVSKDLYFYDGAVLKLWKSGSIRKVGAMEFSVDQTIYKLDAGGNEISTYTLLKIPAAIKRTDDGVYWCYQYSQQESYDMGGQYTFYSEFYLDDNIISPWYFNKTQCRNIVSVGLNVWSLNENGARTLISGTASDVMYINDDEFYIHSQDSIYKTIMFGIYPEDYSLNYILNATEWIDVSGDYYSGNGYIWSESGRLREEATALNDFNATPYPIDPEPIYGQAPVVIASGVHAGILYWIELNSGWLFEYEIMTDTLIQKYRLYNGDGMHETGVEKAPFIKTYISGGVLYFTVSGSIFEVDLETGFINIFYAGQGEIIRYE